MESGSLGILFILGIGVVGGIIGANIFQRLHVPQVVGYIVIGLIIGQSGLNLVKPDDINTLQPFSFFALGVIGFLVGGELKLSTFRKYAKQFTAILLGEGLAAFLLVGISSGMIMYMVTHNGNASLGAGIVFGAIASATDPASTIDVLWEYRSRGVLTTAIIAIVALDDALAMTLYGLGTSVAGLLAGGSSAILEETKRIGIELIGAIVLGVVCAFMFKALWRWISKPEKALAMAIGLLLLAIGISLASGLDVILATMTMGFVLVNTAPRHTEELLTVMRNFSIPIYVLFFVLVGARLGLGNMPGWLWLIVAFYIICRNGGKMIGAWAAAKATGSEAAVRKYLGLGIFAQGGVAVGLSIMASHRLAGIDVAPGMSLGDAVIYAVTATTLIVQLSGPPLVKLAIKLAGEAGRNITEDDIIDTLTVADVMNVNITPIRDNTPISTAVQYFAEQNSTVFPVVDKENRITGTLSLSHLKEVLADTDSWSWLLAADVMDTSENIILATSPLRKALAEMRDLGIDQMAVINNEQERCPKGVLDVHAVRKRVAGEMLHRQEPQPA